MLIVNERTKEKEITELMARICGYCKMVCALFVELI